MPEPAHTVRCMDNIKNYLTALALPAALSPFINDALSLVADADQAKGVTGLMGLLIFLAAARTKPATPLSQEESDTPLTPKKKSSKKGKKHNKKK